MLRDGRARVRGVAANSFGAWLPSSAWRAAQRFSSAPRSDLGTALNPTLMGIYGRQRAELVFEATRRHTFHQTAVSTYFSLDFGEYRKGILGRWGVDKRDATADRRLIEFCLSLPLDMLMKDGVRRPLARAALSDRLPPVLLNEKRKGHQAAGWHHSLENDRPAILDFLSRLEQNPDASAMLDAGAMRTWVQHWPQGGWTDADVIARYRTALLTGLAAGAFLLQASS
jgi:asparagine synthase (glutamine-hydrolysing)